MSKEIGLVTQYVKYMEIPMQWKYDIKHKMHNHFMKFLYAQETRLEKEIKNQVNKAFNKGIVFAQEKQGGKDIGLVEAWEKNNKECNEFNVIDFLAEREKCLAEMIEGCYGAGYKAAVAEVKRDYIKREKKLDKE